MNERELQIIKEHIEKTLDAGLKKTVEPAIKTSVNGKIEQLRQEFLDHEVDFNNHRKEFTTHKKKVESVLTPKNLEAVEKILLGFSGGSLWIKFIMVMGGLIITIGGAIVTIKKIF